MSAVGGFLIFISTREVKSLGHSCSKSWKVIVLFYWRKGLILVVKESVKE